MQAIETTFTVILHHITAPCVQLDQYRMAGIYERKLKLVHKTRKKNVFGLFIFPQKLCRQLKRFLQSFYIILGLDVCSYIKTVWLGSEKKRRK